MTPDRVEALLAPLLDSAYRTALCLADGPAGAEVMLVEAALRSLQPLETGGPDQADARSRILRAMVQLFRHPRRYTAGTPDAGRGPEVHPDAECTVRAIRALAPSSRMVAALYFCDGLTCGEIARLLGCSQPAVRRRVAAARAALHGVAASREAALGSRTPRDYRSVAGAGAPVSGGSTSRAMT